MHRNGIVGERLIVITCLASAAAALALALWLAGSPTAHAAGLAAACGSPDACGPGRGQLAGGR